MSLHVLRGREPKPPLRSVPSGPAHTSDISNRQEASKVTSIAAAKSRPAPRFPINPETRAFYRRFFPGTSSAEWNDWRWQLRARIRSLDELERIFALSEDERDAVSRHQGALPVGITPYYASLMGLDDPRDP